MHVLITAGPTREYLDDVRYLSNASSGRMGYLLAESMLRRGWRVTLVSGPVSLEPPSGAEFVPVRGAQDMFDACMARLPSVDGVIAVAAVADFRPAARSRGKLNRDAGPLHVELVPNPDILAEIGRRKAHQWTVGFAIESDDALARARTKLQAKNCDAIVVNSHEAMEATDTAIQLLDRSGAIALEFRGPKADAAEQLADWITLHHAQRNLPSA